MGIFSVSVYNFRSRFCFRVKEERASITKIPGADECESNESESMELQQAFGIEIVALLYTRAAEICQQTTAAKCTAHISVVDMVICFWRLGLW